MPSTRSTAAEVNNGLAMEYSDDEFDPDYRESSDEDNEDDVPKTMARDRARWIEDNVEDIEWLYRKVLTEGRSVFGNSFLQLSTINIFANYLYRNTTPFSEP